MWERLGVGGRWAVILAIQVIACLMFGASGLLLYPALWLANRIFLLCLGIWIHLTTRNS